MILGEIEKLIKTKKKIECFVKARANKKKKGRKLLKEELGLAIVNDV